MRGETGVSSGKILYFVPPGAKQPPRGESDLHRLMEMARKAQEDSLARQHFNDLLKGIWPASQRTPAELKQARFKSSRERRNIVMRMWHRFLSERSSKARVDFMRMRSRVFFVLCATSP